MLPPRRRPPWTADEEGGGEEGAQHRPHGLLVQVGKSTLREEGLKSHI